MKTPTADTNRFYMLAKDKAREAVKCERISRQLASKEIYAYADQCWRDALDAMQMVEWEQ